MLNEQYLRQHWCECVGRQDHTDRAARLIACLPILDIPCLPAFMSVLFSGGASRALKSAPL